MFPAEQHLKLLSFSLQQLLKNPGKIPIYMDVRMA